MIDARITMGSNFGYLRLANTEMTMSGTDDDLEDLVRRRAYELWEAAGRPEGQHEEFWHTARDEIAKETEQGGKTGADAPVAPTSNEEPTMIEPQASRSRAKS